MRDFNLRALLSLLFLPMFLPAVRARQLKLAGCSHPGGAVLITDAIAAMGLPDGVHSLGEHVQVRRLRRPRMLVSLADFSQ